MQTPPDTDKPWQLVADKKAQLFPQLGTSLVEFQFVAVDVDMCDDGAQVFVIDTGTCLTKTGLAGDDHPWTFPTKAPAAADDPIQRGVVTNWEAMEKIWDYALSKELKVPPGETPSPVLLTEPLNNPKHCREQMVEIWFEKFSAPALYIATQPVLSYLASCRSTAVVVESGEGLTQVVPIYEGYPIPGAVRKVEFGGRDLTEYFMKLLRERGDNGGLTGADVDHIRKVKEEICYVAADYDKEMEKKPESVEIPGKVPFNVTQERFMVPELLFGAQDFDLPPLIEEAISKCPMDTRKDLSANILLSGGNTCFRGIAERLEHRLGYGFTVIAPESRHHSAWLGGSIFGSSSSFYKQCISRHEYDEQGAAVVHRKCPQIY